MNNDERNQMTTLECAVWAAEYMRLVVQNCPDLVSAVSQSDDRVEQMRDAIFATAPEHHTVIDHGALSCFNRYECACGWQLPTTWNTDPGATAPDERKRIVESGMTAHFEKMRLLKHV